MASMLVFFDDDVDVNCTQAEMKNIVKKLKRKLEEVGSNDTVEVSLSIATDREAEDNSKTASKKRRSYCGKKEETIESRPSQSKQCSQDANSTSLVCNEEETHSVDSGIGLTSPDNIKQNAEPSTSAPSTGSNGKKQKKLSSRLQRVLAAKELKKSRNRKDSCQRCDLCGKQKYFTCTPTSSSVAISKIPGKSVIVSLDCEFVGVGPMKKNGLGRCSIIDMKGQVLCDVYVRPEEQITDFRTPWSGIRQDDLRKAIPFESAQNLIRNVIKDKIVVGHALHNDFRVLSTRHPSSQIRDTSKYPGLLSMAGLTEQTSVSLKNLTHQLLGRKIQTGEHCSVEDAKAAMDLYKLVRTSWEQELLDARKASDHCNCAAVDRNENTDSFLDDAYWPDDVVN